MMSNLLKFRFDPAGANAHYLNALRLQFPADGTGKVQDIAFACSVNSLIGNRLPGGIGTHIHNPVTTRHIRDARMAHTCESKRIDGCTLQLLLQIFLSERAEYPAAGCVDQNANFRRGLFQKILIDCNAVKIREIKNDWADRCTALIFEFLQTLCPAGNDP